MAQLSIPHSAEDYHGKTTIIEHEKQIRNQNDSITQRFKFKIEVNEGQMILFIQKDDQRKIRVKQESQIRSLTVDVILNLLVFMEFELHQIKAMKKTELVEFVCHIFQIPTTDTMKISESDTIDIIQNQINVIEEGSAIMDIIEYIENYQSNLTIIAQIIELCQQQSVDLGPYCQELWIGIIDIFQMNKNDDFQYKKAYNIFVTSEKIISLQNNLQNEVKSILNTYNDANNKSVKLKSFWYAFNLSVFRFFNYSVKEYVISTYSKQQQFDPTTVTEQRKCSIYKYFGSGLYGLQKIYKGNNYGDIKSKDLLSIIDKCLLSYDTHDFEAGKNNVNPNDCDDEKCKNQEYFRIPLRLRLQNRGYLRLINDAFYKNIAIPMYSIIVNAVQQIFTCYEAKKIHQIEQQIVEDEVLFTAFDKHIGTIDISDDNDEQEYKKKVLKDLAHRVTSRIVLSLIKRNKINNGHVGQFRTRIKVLHSKQ